MGGEKKPLGVSELGCADGCGWEMGSKNCADGCGWRGCTGVAGNGWGEEAAGDEPLVMSELGCADGCGRQMGGENCADGVGAREWLEMGGGKTGKKALEISDRVGARVAGNGGDERASLRGRLRTANG